MSDVTVPKKLDGFLGLLSRLILGSIFLYSGLYKVLNPRVFESSIANYKIVPEWLAPLISKILPYVELLLGILLVLHLFHLISSFAVLGLLITFIVSTLANSLAGGTLGCGCFPKYSFLNSDNAVFLLIRNYLFAFLALLTLPLTVREGFRKRIRANRYGIIASFAFLFSFLVVPLAAAIFAQKNNVNRYYEFVANELKVFKDEADSGILKDLVGTDLHGLSDSPFEVGPNKKIGILLTLNSSNCSLCIDEAVYLQELKKKYGKEIAFYLAAGNIGHTAVSDLKKVFLIDYPVIQDARLINSKGFSNFKSIRTIFSREGIILRVEPLTYNLKELRLRFEREINEFLE